MDLAQFAGADHVDLDLAGKKYRVGELTLKDWAEVQSWIKATVPGPLSSLASPDFRKLPNDLKRDVLAEVLEQDRTSWPPRIGSKGWFLALDNPGGHATLLLALLGKHQPIDIAEAGALADAVAFSEILPAVMAGLGLFGPKSRTPGPGAKTRTARRGRRRTTSGTSPTSSPLPGDGAGTTSST